MPMVFQAAAAKATKVASMNTDRVVNLVWTFEFSNLAKSPVVSLLFCCDILCFLFGMVKGLEIRIRRGRENRVHVQDVQERSFKLENAFDKPRRGIFGEVRRRHQALVSEIHHVPGPIGHEAYHLSFGVQYDMDGILASGPR